MLNGSTPALSQNSQYTPRLQLCRITTLTSGTMPASCTDAQHVGNVMDRSYDFHLSAGNNGDVFAITNYRDSTRSQAFTYDALNRLTSGWSSANTGTYSWGENYTIDAWGNLQIAPMGNKAHGGYFPNGSDVTNRPIGLGYDAAGNMTNYTAPGQYVYDAENRLSSTAGTSYIYDGNGERVLKSNTSSGAPIKRYWSMGGNTLAEGDGSGNLTAEYVYFGGKRVARIDLPANTVHYYLSDHLGSTSIVASATGTVEEESDYSPFGTEVIVTGPAVNELKFTGMRRDTESQLDYFGARYYSKAFGRFLTPDWSTNPVPVPYGNFYNPQSLNLYGFVGGNPMSKVDIDGHQSSAVLFYAPITCGFCDPIRNAYHEIRTNPRQAANDAGRAFVAFAQSFVNLLPYGDNKPYSGYKPPAGAPAPSSAVGQLTIVSLGIATAAAPVPKGAGAAEIVNLTTALKTPSLIGFSTMESAMIGKSMDTLSGLGYDLSGMEQLVKADMPPSHVAMSLSTPPTGAALGDAAFSSQEMLDHTLEEELLHLGQDLSNQPLGRGDAAANEAAVDAVRKIPEPPK
jgi:RHS repeat-associated protein